jgi:hypothetical protein
MKKADLFKDPAFIKFWIGREKENRKAYLKKYPASLSPSFDNELRNLGFVFEVSSQIWNYLPDYKDIIIPIAVRHYLQAKYEIEKEYFKRFFRIKELGKVVPMLLDEYNSPDSKIDRWAIGNLLFQIGSKKYVNEYLEIITDKQFGTDSQMFIMLLGKLKAVIALTVLLELLEDEETRLFAVSALSDYRREELRPHFERFVNDEHIATRKYAIAALKMLG